jgi:hypothetical protein
VMAVRMGMGILVGAVAMRAGVEVGVEMVTEMEEMGMAAIACHEERSSPWLVISAGGVNSSKSHSDRLEHANLLSGAMVCDRTVTIVLAATNCVHSMTMSVVVDLVNEPRRCGIGHSARPKLLVLSMPTA